MNFMSIQVGYNVYVHLVKKVVIYRLPIIISKRWLFSCEDYLPVIKAGCDMTVHQHITATSMLAMQSVLIDNNEVMHLTLFQNQTCKNHK